MSYTDFSSKIIEDAFVVFPLTLTGTVSAGELCTKAGVLADSDVASADCIALEDGVSGDVIKAAKFAVIKKNPTFATGGGITAADHSGTAGTLLYLSSTAGHAAESAGTISQKVGWVIDVERAFLHPQST